MFDLKTVKQKKKQESIKTKSIRIGYNLFPTYYLSGGWMLYLSNHFDECAIEIKKSLITRSLFGHLHGGTTYSAIDAPPMGMLGLLLGKDVVVWDKSAKINYLKPIRQKRVYAYIYFSSTTLNMIKEKLAQNGVTNTFITIPIQDQNGTVYAEIIKEIHIENKQRFLSRKKFN